MKLAKFLLLPLILSLLLFVHYSDAVVNSFHILQRQLHITPHLVLILIISVFLQLAGQVIRARKAEYLFQPIKENTTRFQFRALSIGYLFNALLPLRLGELIRARIIAGALDLSFSFTLSLIIVERAFDAAILGIAGLIVLSVLAVAKPILVSYLVGFLVVAVVVTICVLLVITQNNRLFRWFYRLSAIFRENIKHSFRFKVWSVIYGLQRTLQPKRLMRYLGYSLLSWFLYLCSLFVLVQYFFPSLQVGQKILAALGPYYGLAIPAGPANLGVFSRIANTFTQSLHLGLTNLLVYNLLAWAVLIIPITLIGLVLLLTKTPETLWRRSPQQTSTTSLANKLHRSEDISQEMARFLENYFSGNSLSHIVHQLEVQKNFRLLKYFKGGSDAITILALQDDQEIVKKIIPLEFEDRLKAQYDWLEKRRGLDGLVNVLREEHATNYYAIDLEYRPDDVMFFDFIHQKPLPQSQRVIDEVWQQLSKHVHGKPAKLAVHSKERNAYIKKHIYDCLEKAAKVDVELLRATEPPRLKINGHEYDNLYQIMAKIKKHPQAWKDIASYKETAVVHGDVAVDNILVSATTGHALLIDPAPDGNIINSPVFDFGKNMQSLYCGYEFLLRDEAPVQLIDDCIIDYQEHKSDQFTQLCQYVRQDLAPKYLNESEQRAIIFHAAALHIRRLKHQVYYNPANTLKFYAVGVKTLNDFLAQYDI